VPTLLIVGQYDFPSKLKATEQLAVEIPQARLIVIPGAAHMVNMEQPEKFNRIVLDFLSLTHP
jgi:3-oxoadipate enol-lactonase